MGLRVMGVYSKPLNGASGLTTNLPWWYRLIVYGRLCLICFYKELGFDGFVLCFKFCIFDRPI
jgi:hypothetical protein